MDPEMTAGISFKEIRHFHMLNIIEKPQTK
jgi:hypothetical protein